MDLAVDQFVVAPRFRMMLLAMLAGMGLLLAVVGIYAVISYSVNRRAPEMAMRVALGADNREIVRLILGQGLKLAAAGTVVGLAGSIVGGRLLRSLLYDLAPFDPPTLAGATVVVLGIVLMAFYPAARRAASTDACEVLRGDAA